MNISVIWLYDEFFCETLYETLPRELVGRYTYSLTILRVIIWHLEANLQELGDFHNFSCVLGYEYFGDMIFG